MKKMSALAVLLMSTAVQAVEAPSSEVPSAPVMEAQPLKWESGVIFGIGNGIEVGCAASKPHSVITLTSVLDEGSDADNIIADVGPTTYFPCVGNSNRKIGLAPGYSGNLQIGYDCKLRDLMAVGGFLFEGGLGTSNGRPEVPVISAEDGVLNPEVIMGKGKFRHQGYLACSLRGGLALGRCMPFLKAGWSIDRWRLRFPYTKGHGKWINSLLIGWGVDINLTRTLLLGISADARISGRVKFKKLNASGDPAATGSARVRPFLLNTLLWLKYKIPVCNR